MRRYFFGVIISLGILVSPVPALAAGLTSVQIQATTPPIVPATPTNQRSTSAVTSSAISGSFDPVGIFVWDGNSLTQPRNGAVAMPVNVQKALGSPPHLQYVNAGENGHTTTEMLTTALRLVDPSPKCGQINLLGVWEGVNDLYFGASAQLAYDHLKQYSLDRKKAGFTVVLLSLIPRADSGLPADFEQNRQAVNTLLRANWKTFADVFVDVAADPIMGDVNTPFGGIYISSVDRVHLTDAGSSLIASLVANAVKPVLQNAATSVSFASSDKVAVNGDALTKTGADGWDGGAISAQRITSGDGYIEFTTAEKNKTKMAGLGNGDVPEHYKDIAYAIYPYTDGNVWIFENGVCKQGPAGTGCLQTKLIPWSVGETFRVAIESGVVKYYKNASLLYTSLVKPAYPLGVDASLYSTGATLSNVRIASKTGATTVNFTSPDKVEVDGNALTKTGADGWDGGAISAQSITSGDAYIEFTTAENIKIKIAGLGIRDGAKHYRDIAYAIYPYTDGNVWIFENSVCKQGPAGTDCLQTKRIPWSVGDTFRVAIESGVVKYYKNASLLYRSSVTPTYPLGLDASLYSTGATLSNVRIASAACIFGTATSVTPPQAHTLPKGSVDTVSTDGLVSGWSFDPDAPSTSNSIRFYIDGTNTTGTLLFEVTTSLLNADTNSIFGISGNHGFQFTIPTSYHDGKSHSLYGYAVDSQDKTSVTPLSNSPVSFTLPSRQ